MTGDLRRFHDDLVRLYEEDRAAVGGGIRSFTVATSTDSTVTIRFYIGSSGPFGYQVDPLVDGLVEFGPERLAAYTWLTIAEFVQTADVDAVAADDQGVRWVPGD